jgi:tetratricopeptide (TPR) repeat protein
MLDREPDDADAHYLRAQAHHILALQHAASGRPADVPGLCARAERDYRRCLALAPQEHDAINSASWFLAIAPDPSFRAPEEAAALARRGLEHFPRSTALMNDLGVALYRGGHWADAVAILDRARGLRGEPDNAHDGFFLSMALVRLGRIVEARRRFDRAADWMDRNNPRHHELLLFRAEAASLLDTTRPMPDGLDAFSRH